MRLDVRRHLGVVAANVADNANDRPDKNEGGKNKDSV